jgi:sterol desaturase/sphingolipid hydroxylase (fatty acid hydroxylase superfamily)
MKGLYAAGAVFGLLSFRYLLLSVGSFQVLWRWKRERFEALRIQRKFPPVEQLWKEVYWSISAFVMIAVAWGALYQNGIFDRSKVYFAFHEHGVGYFLLSIATMMLVHDTYFYWSHRLMHWKPVFKLAHHVHHESVNPSPLAAFSFHPTETVIEALVVLTMPFVLPIHPAALGIFLFASHCMNAMGHLGYELFPPGFARGKVTGWVNTATHHNMHHQYFTSNYGLYFNFWDRLMGTNHPRYLETFERITAGIPKRDSQVAPVDGSLSIGVT